MNHLLNHLRREGGFTLVELLVVMLVLGILVTIAIPTFFGQRVKGQDAAAMSEARSAVSHMELCFTESESYIGCTLAGSGLAVGTGRGEVSVDDLTLGGYVITAVSESSNAFYITRHADGTTSRTCDVNQSSRGGCKVGDVW